MKPCGSARRAAAHRISRSRVRMRMGPRACGPPPGTSPRDWLHKAKNPDLSGPGLSGGPRNRTWRCGFGDHRVTDTPVPRANRILRPRYRSTATPRTPSGDFATHPRRAEARSLCPRHATGTVSHTCRTARHELKRRHARAEGNSNFATICDEPHFSSRSFGRADACSLSATRADSC
jgi:hypothetical protein